MGIHASLIPSFSVSFFPYILVLKSLIIHSSMTAWFSVSASVPHGKSSRDIHHQIDMHIHITQFDQSVSMSKGQPATRRAP